MELNLRKARKLEQALSKHLEKHKPKFVAEIRAKSLLGDAETELEAHRIDLLKALERREVLVQARFDLRSAIEDANKANGIIRLMNVRESLKALLADLQGMGGEAGSLTPRSDPDTLRDLLEAKQVQMAAGQRGYDSSGVTISESILTADDLEERQNKAAELKKQLEDVEDQLSQKNLGAKLTLSSELESLLKAAKLV